MQYRISALVGLLAATLILPAGAADTLHVTTALDNNDGACDAHCSLREAVVAANASSERDVIVLPPGTYVLTAAGAGEDRAATGDLDIRENVVIQGAGAAVTIIDGGGLDRVLHVLRDDDAYEEPTEVSNLTITGGRVSAGSEGGGVLNVGNLRLSHSFVSGNAAEGFESDGGGIANAGVLGLVGVTIRDNTTDGGEADGGGVWNRFGTLSLTDCELRDNSVGQGNGGGLWTEFGTVVLLRSTVAGNSAPSGGGDGGGLWAGFSTLTAVNSTFSGNTAGDDGAGLEAEASTVTLTSCTFTDNDGDDETLRVDLGTTFVSNTLVDGECSITPLVFTGGGNLESPGNSCGFIAGSDQRNVDEVDLGLGPLADNGGPTRTHALLPGSLAIDAGIRGTCPDRDQRGSPRPVDGDGDGEAVCDVGAYELGGETVPSFSYWVPAAMNGSGAHGTFWTTALGVLNRSSSDAELEIVLHGGSAPLSMVATLAGDGQEVFDDIVGQLGGAGRVGTLEIRSDQPLIVTSRISTGGEGGTVGQYLAGMTVDQGLRAGDSASLPQLSQSEAFRTNIGLANLGTDTAEAVVTLHDAAGVVVGSMSVALQPAELRQLNEVFSSAAGLDDIRAGYATVRVISGSGVVTYASVVDNFSGDATTIPMGR